MPPLRSLTPSPSRLSLSEDGHSMKMGPRASLTSLGIDLAPAGPKAPAERSPQCGAPHSAEAAWKNKKAGGTYQFAAGERDLASTYAAPPDGANPRTLWSSGAARARFPRPLCRRVMLTPAQRGVRLLLAGLPLFALGCAVVDSGTLTVGWSLDGSATEARCDAYGAEKVVISVADTYGATYATDEFDCADFSATFDELAVGSYQVTARLQDADDETVGDEAGPTDVTIEANTTTRIVLNFDEDSLAGAGLGTLRIDWTIDERTDADLCEDHGAADLELALYDEDGILYEDVFTIQCSEFTIDLEELPSGSYFVAVQLVKANGSGMGVIFGPQLVTVVVDTTTVLDFNFDGNDL
jgi:hypothetical protein